MKRIKLAATLLILPTSLFLLYYYYRAMQWQLNMAFLEPDRWMNSSFVHPDAVIASSTRALYFAMWQVPLLCGVAAYIAALWCLVLLSKGCLFHRGIARCCMSIGGFSILSSATHLIAAAFSPRVLSLHNPDGPAALRFWYSSSHFSLIFYGFAFLLMGWILIEAIRIDAENQEFV